MEGGIMNKVTGEVFNIKDVLDDPDHPAYETMKQFMIDLEDGKIDFS